MKLTDILISDLDREVQPTQRALQAVPEGREDWKPHDKSMPLGRLASLVAMMPAWMTMMIEQDEFDIAPPSGGASQFSQLPKTGGERLKTMREGFAGAKKALQTTNDDHLQKPWRLKAGGKTVVEAPRHAMMRDVLMHMSHHRGQLTVYLRLNNVPVPAIYGPSADDQRF